MKTHPLGHEALENADWYAVPHMPYPSYKYESEESFTKLELSYQDGEYVLVDGRLFRHEEYWRGQIANVDDLMKLMDKYKANDRAVSEIGREMQDADFIIGPIFEEIDGVYLGSGNMRLFRFRKELGRYVVTVNLRGTGGSIEHLGTFNSLREAVDTAKSF